MCATAKIIVSPRYPYDDFFWTGSFYNTLANKGFLVFPRLEGLMEEGFEDGVQFTGYTNYAEMIEIINWFLDPKNEKAKEGLKTIPVQGQDFVIKNFTLKDRLEVLLKVVK